MDVEYILYLEIVNRWRIFVHFLLVLLALSVIGVVFGIGCATGLCDASVLFLRNSAEACRDEERGGCVTHCNSLREAVKCKLYR
jgi:hypothetical protein